MAGPVNFFAILGSFVLSGYLMVIGKTILIPFILALFFWYLIHAVASFYKRALPDHYADTFLPKLALPFSLLAVIGMIVAIVYGIRTNLTEVIAMAPIYQEKLRILAEKGLNAIPFDHDFTVSQITEKISLPKIIGMFVGSLTMIIKTTGLILLYVVFLLAEAGLFQEKLNHLSSNVFKFKKKNVLQNIDEKIKLYLTVKTMVSISTALISYVIMKSVGLDFASFWAVVIFLLNYVPTFGSIIGTLFPVTIALVQFDSLTPFLIVAIGISLAQIIIGNIIEPRIMGNSLNLSPLMIMLSLVIFGMLWGVLGMFVCVPLTVILMIVLSEFKSTRWVAVMMSQNGKLEIE